MFEAKYYDNWHCYFVVLDDEKLPTAYANKEDAEFDAYLFNIMFGYI